MVDSATALGDVVVNTRGPAKAGDIAYARRKIRAVCQLTTGPVLFTKIDLVVHEDPARERPAFAKAELDLNGRIVRAHAAATTLPEAVDMLDGRLRERIERVAHRQEALHLRHRGGATAWRHGDEPTSRAPFFPRPHEEREIVRRKSFAVGALTPEEATLELEQLDHDFYLFNNAETGEDNVLHRVGEGRYELLQPSRLAQNSDTRATTAVSPMRPRTLTTEEAADELDVTEEPFVFFLDPATHRGRVIYRRYDGHYGLITPADPSR